MEIEVKKGITFRINNGPDLCWRDAVSDLERRGYSSSAAYKMLGEMIDLVGSEPAIVMSRYFEIK
jgi:hypothetical protein